VAKFEAANVGLRAQLPGWAPGWIATSATALSASGSTHWQAFYEQMAESGDARIKAEAKKNAAPASGAPASGPQSDAAAMQAWRDAYREVKDAAEKQKQAADTIHRAAKLMHQGTKGPAIERVNHAR
jgi:hypothetical protein